LRCHLGHGGKIPRQDSAAGQTPGTTQRVKGAKKEGAADWLKLNGFYFEMSIRYPIFGITYYQSTLNLNL